MNKFLLSAAALAVAVPSMAQVQAPSAPRAPMAPMAPRVEATQTRDQVVAKVRDHFAKADTNRDGFIASDEMQAMRGHRAGMKHPMGERRGGRMAHNAPGARDPSAMFDRLDANRDGSISRDEFSRGHQMRVERKVAINGAPGAPGAGEHRAMRKMHRMGGMMRGHMLRTADVDRDGRVSLQEATTTALQHFDRVDANRDGRITPDERRQNREQRRQSRAPKAG